MEEDRNKKQQETIEYINDFPTEEEERLRIAQEEQAEIAFQKAQKKAEFKAKIIKVIKIFAVIIILSSIIAILLFFLLKKDEENKLDPSSKEFSIKIPENKEHVFANDVEGIIKDEKTSTEINSYDGLVGKSENYQIRDIAIGGGSIVLAAETEILPIKIYDVKTETLFSRDQKETKLLITWKTNKLARSDVRYAKAGSDGKTLKENSYGFSHALVLNKLDQSTRYSFFVEATDRGGGKAKSDEFVVFTGTKAASVFELISSEMDNIFGWALKK